MPNTSVVNRARTDIFEATVVKAGAFIGSQILTQGNTFFVRPGTGNDNHDGKSPQTAFATLTAALAACTANQNDVVYLIAESNSASATTARVTTASAAALDWNKDLVHLIGVNSGAPYSQRSRVAFDSDFVSAVNLFTLSANGCLIANISFYAGVADANPTGCFLLTGERNRIVNCHLAGIGHDDNDISGAYSLKIDGGGENLIDDCTIGLDTIARGTNANSGLLIDGGAARNEFRDCRFVAQVEHATNHVHVRLADVTAIDRSLLFKRCVFYYMSANYSAAATAIMSIPNLTQGYILVDQCFGIGDAPGTVPKWDVNDNNKIYVMHSPTPAADTAGIARAV